MITRRQFIAMTTFVGTTGAAIALPRLAGLGATAAADLSALAILDPTTIPKYVSPLFMLPQMPPDSTSGNLDSYSIAARQFSQQILPRSLPATKVFGYGASADSSTFHYPSYTVEARVNRPVRVNWQNQLMTRAGDFLPHLLPVDPTLHWNNPGGGTAGRDSRPTFTTTPTSYRGPVSMVTHLHGAHVFEESDGYPNAWYLPKARNIPAGFAKVGSFYDQFRDEAHSRFGVTWDPGSATFQYPNDQRATSLWFHAHDLGMTRTNVYAGLTGLYFLRGGATDLPDGVLPGPAPRLGEAPGTRHYEIPLVIQCKAFNSDGSLFFPADRGFFGDVPPAGPFSPDSDVSPIWNPEFFGNTIVVNGQTWPTLSVEPRRYRLRLLNASNTRVLLLKVVTDPLARPATAALPMTVIGTDGGFLPAPVPLARVRLAVAERADVIVDLTGVPVGTKLYIINEGPDEPFGGGEPDVDFVPADPNTTGQVMQLVVGPLAAPDTSVPVSRLTLPALPRLGAATTVRKLSLNEMESGSFAGAPTMGMLGTLGADGKGVPLHWSDPVTENVPLGATEIWEFHNFTVDGHPVHVHLVEFEVVNRQAFGGAPRPPEAWETGTKDTLVALPSEITRIKAKFDRGGRFVWHCHIIDHEDNEMMRPYQIG
jgi:spore coat protein A